MRVLSLFDGIACGYEALKRAEIKIDEYVAYEIDKNAIAIAKKNHPDIREMGSVVGADFTQYRGFDLVIGGSPCQGFSIAGKQLNFEDPRSKLYFEFERAIREVNPHYWFLENVAMRKDFEEIISERLGVEPLMINSNLVSAQNRKRLYWTNIKNITIPNDKGIVLADIVHENECGFSRNLEPYKVSFDKTLQILDKEIQRGKIRYFCKDDYGNRAYSIHGKTVTLCGDVGDEVTKIGQYLFGCITPDRINKRQNGQRFNKGDKFYTLTAQDRHGVLINGYIRKLTPIECERLQTLPDNYTLCDGVSESARYKALGNCWTVDVVAHCFSFIK